MGPESTSHWIKPRGQRQAKAGGNATVNVNQYLGPDLAQISGAMMSVLVTAGLATGLAPVQEVAVPAHEKYLSEQLDHLRDGAKTTDPDTNLRLFRSFMDSLPADASATITSSERAVLTNAPFSSMRKSHGS